MVMIEEVMTEEVIEGQVVVAVTEEVAVVVDTEVVATEEERETEDIKKFIPHRVGIIIFQK